MAYYLVRSSTTTIVGSDNDDNFSVESGAQRVSLQGNDGNDEFRLFDAGVNSSYTFGNSTINGNEGDDTIRFQFQSGIAYIANFVGGGEGNDQILLTGDANDTFDSAALLNNVLQGGEGNDTIKIKFDGEDNNFEVANLTVQGGQGVDYISFSASAGGGVVRNLFFGGGSESDQLIVDVNTTGSENITVNGGQGSDRIRLEIEDTATNVSINGGRGATDDFADGDDNIYFSADTVENASVQGNRGNDLIIADMATASDVLIAGNAGNDTIRLSGDTYNNVTVRGGAGDDVVRFNTGGIFVSGGANSIIGGDGNDIIAFSGGESFSASVGEETPVPGVTFEGGAGADIFGAIQDNLTAYISDPFRMQDSSRDRQNSALQFERGSFRYGSLSDSTIDNLDTIVVNSGGNESTADTGLFTLIMPQDVQVFRGNAGGFIFTSGLLSFETGAGSGDFNTLANIVGALDGVLEEGDAVGFKLFESAQAGYVFVQGDDDDLLVRFEGFGTAAMGGNAGGKLRRTDSDTLELNLGWEA